MRTIRLAYAELDVIRNDARAMLAPLGAAGALRLAEIEAQVAMAREKYARHAAELGEILGDARTAGKPCEVVVLADRRAQRQPETAA